MYDIVGVVSCVYAYMQTNLMLVGVPTGAPTIAKHFKSIWQEKLSRLEPSHMLSPLSTNSSQSTSCHSQYLNLLLATANNHSHVLNHLGHPGIQSSQRGCQLHCYQGYVTIRWFSNSLTCLWTVVLCDILSEHIHFWCCSNHITCMLMFEQHKR